MAVSEYCLKDVWENKHITSLIFGTSELDGDVRSDLRSGHFISWKMSPGQECCQKWSQD